MSKWIALVIGVGILIIAGYIGTNIFVKNVRSDRAETMGVKYAANLYAEYAVIGKTCQGEDTDGDTYVSCDLRLKNANGVEKVIYLNCPTIWKSLTGSSCKERTLIPGQ